MPLRGWLRREIEKSREEEKTFQAEIGRFKIGRLKKIVVLPEIKKKTEIDIKYPLIDPFAYARIRWDAADKNLVYDVLTPELTSKEMEIFEKIKRGLTKVLELELSQMKTRSELLGYIQKKTKEVIDESGIELKPGEYTRILYYVYVTFVGLNEIEPLMQDSYIEDLGCDGVNTPIYVVHKKYGSVKTNIIYKKPEELQEFVVKLAERCGRYISYAEPLLDGSLPDGSRVQATLASDVTTKGPTFSIRKFREMPYSAVELINLKTVSAEMMAYLWYLIENRTNILVCGATAAGKTTFLNSIVSFVPTENKIVSIEDTRELNLIHENWIPAVARIGFGTMTKEGTRYGEITMFDLLKESFRQNPDYVIVGEVRGKEAYVLFQGMASGHASMSTIHGGSVDDIVKRMETPPIELSPSLLEALDVVVVISHAAQFGKSSRRVTTIEEIQSIDKLTGRARTAKSFVWSSIYDKHEMEYSPILGQIASSKGITMTEVNKDLENRVKVLKWLLKKKILGFNEVAQYITLYYKDKEALLKTIK